MGSKVNNFSSDVNYKLKKDWQIQANGQYLFNEKAPNGRNQGYLAEVGAGVARFSVRAGTFKNESDTSSGVLQCAYLWSQQCERGSPLNRQSGTRLVHAHLLCKFKNDWIQRPSNRYADRKL